ncbi:MAG: zinc ribbon domain-containing protein [Anaerolineales bacterium]
MSASLGLFRLQQVDRQIDRAKTRLDAIKKTLDNDAELKSVQTSFESANEQSLKSLHTVKNAELEVESLKIKIEQAESSLYGGAVKNPKELQDLQKEIASLKKHLLTLEERQLDAMLQAETAGAELDKAKAELEIVQARLGNEHKKLLDEQLELVTQMESLAQEREAALAPIDNALLAAYEDLRKQKRGIAVTEVQDNACASCGTTLNAALQQNARSQKLAYCPSCGRILFAK